VTQQGSNPAYDILCLQQIGMDCAAPRQAQSSRTRAHTSMHLALKWIALRAGTHTALQRNWLNRGNCVALWPNALRALQRRPPFSQLALRFKSFRSDFPITLQGGISFDRGCALT
jgi:hypothetical protein